MLSAFSTTEPLLGWVNSVTSKVSPLGSVSLLVTGLVVTGVLTRVASWSGVATTTLSGDMVMVTIASSQAVAGAATLSQIW